MCWGFECGDGWFQIIWDLCLAIEAVDPNRRVLATQVKEKYGGLRFYHCTYYSPKEYEEWAATSQGTLVDPGYEDNIDDLVDVAEDRSYKTCEECGEPGTCEDLGYWIYTLCEKHMKEVRR